MPDQLNKHLNKQKECIQGLTDLLKESLNDMPVELNQQGGVDRRLGDAAEEEHGLGEEADRQNPATLGGQGEAQPRDGAVEGEERRLEEDA